MPISSQNSAASRQSELDRLNKQPVNQAALRHLNDLPQGQRHLFLNGEEINLPDSESLYLLQLVQWALQNHPPLYDRFQQGNVQELTDQLMFQSPPQAVMQFLCPKEEVRGLVRSLLALSNPLEAGSLLLEQVGNRLAEV